MALPSIEGVALIGEPEMSARDTFLAWLRRDEEGQGLAEYALILALIAIVAIVALIFLGNQVSTILSTGRHARSRTVDRNGERRADRWSPALFHRSA